MPSDSPPARGELGTSRARRFYAGGYRMDIVWRPRVRRILAGAAIARTAQRALEAADAPVDASLGIVLTGDEELARLNAQHMGQPGPTDVLSFPLLPPGSFPAAGRRGPSSGPQVDAARFVPPRSRLGLGDIVISVERAVEQAMQGRGGQTGDVRWSPADELRLLVTHGVLHICGWDHAEPEDEAAMRTLERKLLAAGP